MDRLCSSRGLFLLSNVLTVDNDYEVGKSWDFSKLLKKKAVVIIVAEHFFLFQTESYENNTCSTVNSKNF